MNPSLFLELEEAVNAVEPRVLEGYNPGLSGAEIDALMKNVSFDLPDDLRALYQWKNGSESGQGFLGNYIQMFPLSQGESSFIREEIREAHLSIDEPVPIELDTREFVYLFDDGGDGTTIIATFSTEGSQSCAIFQNYQDDFPMIGMMFRGVEPMIQTAIEAWRSGISTSIEDHRGRKLDYEFKDWFALGRRMNPDCNYWLDGAKQ